MKNNKGYTLVELIVAVAVLLVLMAEVGSLMVNSQHLYRNGFYELNMQENAQQVIEQVQTLLMNANPWDKSDRTEAARDSVVTRAEVTVNGVPSDIITIKTLVREVNNSTGMPTGNFKQVTYQIGRDCDLNVNGINAMQGTAGKEYATLYLSRKEGDADAVYTPMAQGVRAIHLGITQDVDDDDHVTAEVKTNYLNADLLTLTVDMQNQQYSYSSTSEVYLRNQPGTGGPEVPAAAPSTGADTDLNVLRVHKYDMSTLLPAPESGKAWFFKFAEGSDPDLTTKYSMTSSTGGSNTHNIIACSGLNNSGKWGECVTSATVWAAQAPADAAQDDVDWSARKEITIHTDAVNNGEKLPIYGPNRSDPYVSVFPVTGICVCKDCVNTRNMEGQLWLDMNTLTLPGGVDPDIWVLQDHSANVQFKKNAAGDILATNDVIDGGFKNLTYVRMKTTGTGDAAVYTIDLKDIAFKVQGYSKKAGAASTDYSTPELRNNNYEYKGDMFIPTNSGAFAHVYTLQTIKEGEANAFALKCQDQAPQGEAYWNNIVGNNGYIRVKMQFTFKNSVVGTYTCYGYVFPKEFATNDTLVEKLWTMMTDGAHDVEEDYMGHTP